MRILKTLLTNLHSRIDICEHWEIQVFMGLAAVYKVSSESVMIISTNMWFLSLFTVWFSSGSLYEPNVRGTDPLECGRRHALPPEDADDELGLALRVAVNVVSAEGVGSISFAIATVLIGYILTSPLLFQLASIQNWKKRWKPGCVNSTRS